MTKYSLQKKLVSLAATALAVAFVLPVYAQHSALDPVPRPDEWWVNRQAEKVEQIAKGDIDLVFIGDSITQGWEGGAGKDVWAEYYGDRKAVNLGFSGDRTQHVLWRLENSDLETIAPKAVVLMIGTNNSKDNSGKEIGEGLQAIIRRTAEIWPEAKQLVLAIFPRGAKPDATREKLAEASAMARELADGEKIFYLDIGPEFLEEDGTLSKEVMPDLLHLNKVSYRTWAEATEARLADLLGELDAGKVPVGFVPLWNGKDLTGWQGLVENPEKRAAMSPEELAAAQVEADEKMNAHWTVEDGLLVFDGKGSHLCTKRLYEDFEMLVDWKIVPEGDSGIYLRGSPQVQIWDPAQWPQGSGGLYNNKIGEDDPLVVADNPIGEWNRFHIKMVGEKVTVYLNGQLVVDNVVLENYWDRDKPIYPIEQIELQAHGSLVWWDNIYVREIPRGDGWTNLLAEDNSLEGWEEIGGGDDSRWHVENGQLYTEGEGGGWLSTTKEYDNFELELEFKVPPGGNSGVFIRTPREGNPAYAGSEVQILDDNDAQYAGLQPWQYCGSIYSTAAPDRRRVLLPGEWQKMRILADGPNVEVRLNGFDIVDADLSKHLDKLEEHPGLAREGGYIGLQNHGTRLDFRNIRIREIGGE